MKKVIIYIVCSLCAFIVISCHKENLNDKKLPDGYVRLELDMTSNDFANQTLTRSGDGSGISNVREQGIENAYVYVFENTDNPNDGKLLQYVPVILEIGPGGRPIYYASVRESNLPVRVIGLANLTDDLLNLGLEAIKEGSTATLTYGDVSKFDMEYDPEADNGILRKSGNILLPKSTQVFTLNEISQEEIDAELSRGISNFYQFARIDVWITDTDAYEIIGVKALNAPNFIKGQAIPDGKEAKRVNTHEVTRIGNQKPFPFSYTNDDTEESNTNFRRYVQGLYVYSTQADATPISNESEAIDLILRARRTSDIQTGGNYYKLRMRYPNAETFQYGVRANYRYLIKISDLNTDGYSTEAEVIAAPPSKIYYDIIIDVNSTDYVTNGKYYIGVEKGEKMSDSQVKISFTLGDADGGNILNKLTSKSITLPSGATWDTPPSDDWGNSLARQSYLINLEPTFTSGEVTIKVGELTKSIQILSLL